MMQSVLVLMATYNGEKYLEEQLNSLFNQKHVKVSVLVRDDGSSDSTQSILEKWKSNTDLNWYTGEHLNVKYGFLDLMARAATMEYDYYAFCDQDDVWDDDKLFFALQMLKKIVAEKEVLYYCGQRLVNEKLNLIAMHELNRKRTLYARFMLNDAAGCTMVFNRALLMMVNKYKPQYLLMHDAWVVKVCLAVGGKVIVDPQAHMSYRQHGNNTLGLRKDFVSKLKRAIAYINQQKVQAQLQELNEGYGQQLIPEYAAIIADVLGYKHSIRKRINLLNMHKFYFGDWRIQAIYLLKVLFNKL